MNCPRCGKICANNFRNMCPDCIKIVDAECDRCFKYLKENKLVTLDELSKATEVSTAQIIKFIREGRIIIKNNPNMAIKCEMCGSSIKEGTICKTCKEKINKEVQGDENRNTINTASNDKPQIKSNSRITYQHKRDPGGR